MASYARCRHKNKSSILKIVRLSFCPTAWVTLNRYEVLRKKQRNGVAVAGLHHDRCQACRVTVSAQSRQKANEGQFAYCDSCGRILCPI